MPPRSSAVFCVDEVTEAPPLGGVTVGGGAKQQVAGGAIEQVHVVVLLAGIYRPARYEIAYLLLHALQGLVCTAWMALRAVGAQPLKAWRRRS